MWRDAPSDPGRRLAVVLATPSGRPYSTGHREEEDIGGPPGRRQPRGGPGEAGGWSVEGFGAVGPGPDPADHGSASDDRGSVSDDPGPGCGTDPDTGSGVDPDEDLGIHAGRARAGPVGRVGTVLRRWVPEGWRGARLDPGRPGATALALVAAVAAVLAAVGVWADRPRAEPIAALPAVGLSPAGPSAPAPPSTAVGPLVVSVVGKVARPGLVQVPDGARAADAIAAAGGALPGADLTGTNMARRVGDGEQLAVGVPAVADTGGTAPAARPGIAPAPGGKIDLNRATVGQLDALPGVGPVTAQRILDWRTRNGRFARVDQLREVEGIGERHFGQLRELVTV